MFAVESSKSEYNYRHIRITSDIRFHLKQIRLIFRTKFSQKHYFRSNTAQMKVTIEFRILELVKILILSLNIFGIEYFMEIKRERGGRGGVITFPRPRIFPLSMLFISAVIWHECFLLSEFSKS